MIEPHNTTSRPPWHHHAPPPADAALLGLVIWAGRRWACTTYGLERLDGGQAIAARNLGLDWIAPMSTRSGADLPDFIAALAVARLFHDGRDREASAIFASICTRHGLNGFERPRGKPASQ